jgi:hypothetical protein
MASETARSVRYSWPDESGCALSGRSPITEPVSIKLRAPTGRVNRPTTVFLAGIEVSSAEWNSTSSTRSPPTGRRRPRRRSRPRSAASRKVYEDDNGQTEPKDTHRAIRSIRMLAGNWFAVCVFCQRVRVDEHRLASRDRCRHSVPHKGNFGEIPPKHAAYILFPRNQDSQWERPQTQIRSTGCGRADSTRSVSWLTPCSDCLLVTEMKTDARKSQMPDRLSFATADATSVGADFYEDIGPRPVWSLSH